MRVFASRYNSNDRVRLFFSATFTTHEDFFPFSSLCFFVSSRFSSLGRFTIFFSNLFSSFLFLPLVSNEAWIFSDCNSTRRACLDLLHSLSTYTLNLCVTMDLLLRTIIFFFLCIYNIYIRYAFRWELHIFIYIFFMYIYIYVYMYNNEQH